MHRWNRKIHTGGLPVVQIWTVHYFLSSVLQHVERDTILTMLTILSDPTNTQPILYCLRSLPAEICKTPTTCLNGRELISLCPSGRDSIVCLHGPISNPQLHGQISTSQHHGRNSTESFSKILQILGPSLPGMTSFTLQPHFLSGFYYDNGDCHIHRVRA